MIESYLEDGRQDAPDVYGKSITDPCLGWDKTDSLIREIHNRLRYNYDFWTWYRLAGNFSCKKGL